MKQIPLTQGLFALVDDKNFDWLNQFKWTADKGHQTYYAIRKQTRPEGGQRTMKMHREILHLTDPKIEADHKNGNGLDNQEDNLRAATKAQNGANSKKREGMTSRFKGVSWHRRIKRWAVEIRRGKVRSFLGYYDSEEAAARAYDRAAYDSSGEFAKLNFSL